MNQTNHRYRQDIYQWNYCTQAITNIVTSSGECKVVIVVLIWMNDFVPKSVQTPKHMILLIDGSTWFNFNLNSFHLIHHILRPLPVLPRPLAPSLSSLITLLESLIWWWTPLTLVCDLILVGGDILLTLFSFQTYHNQEQGDRWARRGCHSI